MREIFDSTVVVVCLACALVAVVFISELLIWAIVVLATIYIGSYVYSHVREKIDDCVYRWRHK